MALLPAVIPTPGLRNGLRALRIRVRRYLRQLLRLKRQDVVYCLRKLERHPRVRAIKMFCDHVMTVVRSKQYNGNNPAIASVYSPLRCSMIMMVALFFVIFVLGTLVPIESAAVARGTVVVMSNKKTVQHLEGGVIRRILVKEGDLVKKGQPLIELSDVAPKASRNIAKGELDAAMIAENRLLALKNRDEAMKIPTELKAKAKSDPKLQKIIQTQLDLFETQKRAQEGKLGTLEQRIREHEEETIGLEAQIKSAEAQLDLVSQESVPMQELVDKGFASKPQLLALLRRKEELEGNRGQYIASLAKTRQSITEVELQLVTLQDEFATQIGDELREIQSKISDNDERYRAASDVMARTVIEAPYEGIVTGLKFHTEGGVIAPATPIMDIIPQMDQLIVEAKIRPEDIDVVEPGLTTSVVFSAYKTRSLPRLEGEVTTVSADALTSTEGELTSSFYNARVQVPSEELAKVASHIRMYPGMPVEVFIRTGSRSFMGYLFAPITSSLRRAFKED